MKCITLFLMLFKYNAKTTNCLEVMLNLCTNKNACMNIIIYSYFIKLFIKFISFYSFSVTKYCNVLDTNVCIHKTQSIVS